jgi:DNA-binding transcriptional ArsR family regulator
MANTNRAIDGLAALGDPTRRTIFERVAARPQAVGEIARGVPVSRPAVSQHLKVLKDAGLVTETAEGARRIYRIDPRGIGAMRRWLDGQWATALAAFRDFAEAEATAEAEAGGAAADGQPGEGEETE